MTKLDAILDEKDYTLPHRTEPVFSTDGPAESPPHAPEMDEAPAWLNEQPAPPAERRNWKDTLLFWSASIAGVVVVFAAAMWLFDEHGASRPATVQASAQRAPVPAAAPATPAAAASTLPPLVLLAPTPGTATPPKIDKPAPVLAKLPSAPSVPKLASPKAAASKVAGPKPAAPKLAARTGPIKPPSKGMPATPHKALPAKATAVQLTVKAKAGVAVKKPAVAGKHVPLAMKVKTKAKAKPRALAGITLPPARERIVQRDPARAPVAAPTQVPAPAAPAARKCQPGELARECAANN